MNINPIIKNEAKLAYAGGHHDLDSLIDLSSGSNPMGVSAIIVDEMHSIKSEVLSEYPAEIGLKEDIVAHYNNSALKTDNIEFANGSIDAIELVLRIFQAPKAKALGLDPCFTDFVSQAKLFGIGYKGVLLKNEDEYKINVDELISNIDDSISLVYIDNPNNPTGQAISIESIEKILQAAEKHDAALIVDEAYGDYMDKSNSAINIFEDKRNLIVLKSFSKGIGLAGLRAGYIVAPLEISDYIRKISNPYRINNIARILARKSFELSDFLKKSKDEIKKANSAIKQALPAHIKMACSLDTCPINLLYTNKDIDLEREFYKNKVLVYSGVDFRSLNRQSVRIRTPKSEDLNRVLQVIKNL